eukprot:6205185-Pleurochrysis_carterae.AAC.5
MDPVPPVASHSSPWASYRRSPSPSYLCAVLFRASASGRASAAGTAYTMSRRLDAEAAGGLLIEVGLREKAQRVRCKFLYLPDDESRGSGPAQMLRLEKLAVVRENVVGTAAPAASPPGGGLYDPPPGDRTNYFSLYCEDGLTLVFPTTCATDAAGFISVDWTAGAR